MNLERPEPGYFSMVRMHYSKRPVPSDPFLIGSLERPPLKLEVPNPPSLSQVNEYPEAKIGMKFGHRKPWIVGLKMNRFLFCSFLIMIYVYIFLLIRPVVIFSRCQK